MSHINRHAAGDPGGRGGQFSAARKAAPDPGVQLTPDEGTQPPAAAEVDAPSVGELRDMLAPNRPLASRRAASRNAFYHHGLADLAARDADPLVRANALYAPDLSNSDRQRLSADPEVSRLMSVLTK